MHASIRLAAAALCVAAAASAVQAQTVRRIGSATNTVPSASAQANSATPNPSGLRPVFPAGMNSGSGAAVSSDPIAAAASSVPPAGLSGINTPSTSRATGGVNNGRIIPELPSPDRPLAGGGFSTADVVRAFEFADDDRDGVLSAAEAARLSIVTMTFREMDRNGDGLVSRAEYEASVL